MQDYVGKEVSEEYVAKDLGYKDVFELRRSQTEQGIKIRELEYEIKQEQQQSERFKWHGERMEMVLSKAKMYLEGNKDHIELSKLLLAIDVVCCKGVDWKHILKDWGI